MPIYEFKCPKCGNKFEILHRGQGLPEYRKCPDCGQFSPRVFSTFSFQFSLYLRELGKGNMIDY